MDAVLKLLDLAPRAVAAITGAVASVLGVYAAWLSLAVLGGGWGIWNWLTAVGVLGILTPLAVLTCAFANYAVVGVLLSPLRWLVERGQRGAPGREDSGSRTLT